jgi:hypothetical protein
VTKQEQHCRCHVVHATRRLLQRLELTQCSLTEDNIGRWYVVLRLWRFEHGILGDRRQRATAAACGWHTRCAAIGTLRSEAVMVNGEHPEDEAGARPRHFAHGVRVEEGLERARESARA